MSQKPKYSNKILEGLSTREKVNRIIFEADTPHGRLFDVVLLIAIVLSVLVILLESIQTYDVKFHKVFVALEWMFTIIFTIEYGLRIYSSINWRNYTTSFFGIIDLLAILPTYISLFFIGGKYLVTIRALRLLRIFRILKLVRFMDEGESLLNALKASRYKILVFIAAVMTFVIIIGSMMYVIEGEESGFTSIPVAMYWAIVTVTTVGFGDITPQSPLGQFLSTILMLMGYGIIAVPTGIVTSQFTRLELKRQEKACIRCGLDNHNKDAQFCRRCGHDLNIKKEEHFTEL